MTNDLVIQCYLTLARGRQRSIVHADGKRKKKKKEKEKRNRSAVGDPWFDSSKIKRQLNY